MFRRVHMKKLLMLLLKLNLEFVELLLLYTFVYYFFGETLLLCFCYPSVYLSICLSPGSILWTYIHTYYIQSKYLQKIFDALTRNTKKLRSMNLTDLFNRLGIHTEPERSFISWCLFSRSHTILQWDRLHRKSPIKNN